MSEPAPVRPWVHQALQLVQIRTGDRVLQLTAHDPAPARAIAELCGAGGAVVVVEASPKLAERTAALQNPAILVLATELDGRENLGRFDAAVGCPTWNPGWPLDRWGETLRGRLRPGGRFAVDLPAESGCELIDAAWRDAGLDLEGLARWQGPSEHELAGALRAAGLRGVAGQVGTHLARFESPRELAEFACTGLSSDADAVESLTLALARRLKTAAEVEVVFHRTRVHGMR